MRKVLALLLVFFIICPSVTQAASGCTYPSTLDTFVDKVAGDSLTVANVNTLSCAIEKMQAELGTLPKGSFGTVKLRLEDIDARFVKLLGNAGGQTVIGGTAASENLVLQSSSHATRGVVRIGDNFALDANTPAQITADQNNYALSDKGVQRWSSDAARSITGLAGGVNSKVVYAFNVGSFPIVVQHENSGSTAANRVTTVDGLDMTVWAGRGAVFIYDSTTSRWRGSLLGSADYQVVKIADETVNNSSAFQDDDHLFFPVTASRTYEFQMCAPLQGVNVNADAKFQWTVPAGTTMRWAPALDITATNNVQSYWIAGTSATTPLGLLTEASTVTAGSFNGTTGVCFQGTVTSSSTTGNVRLQWAQNLAGATDLKLLAGGWLRVRPIL